MNLGQMRTEVRDIIGEEEEDFWSDLELNRYLNEAHYRFLSEERWPWLLTEGTAQLASADDGELELTEGVAATRHINITLAGSGATRLYQPRRVTPAEGFMLKNRYALNTTAAYPEYFYITSVSSPADDGSFVYIIRFIPAPSADMDVSYQYFRAGAEMDADNIVPHLPVEFHKALIHYAAGTAWLKELNGENKAGEQFQMYAGVVEECRGEWLVATEDDPTVMGADPIARSWGEPWLRDMELDQPLGP